MLSTLRGWATSGPTRPLGKATPLDPRLIEAAEKRRKAEVLKNQASDALKEAFHDRDPKLFKASKRGQPYKLQPIVTEFVLQHSEAFTGYDGELKFWAKERVDSFFAAKFKKSTPPTNDADSASAKKDVTDVEPDSITGADGAASAAATASDQAARPKRLKLWSHFPMRRIIQYKCHKWGLSGTHLGWRNPTEVAADVTHTLDLPKPVAVSTASDWVNKEIEVSGQLCHRYTKVQYVSDVFRSNRAVLPKCRRTMLLCEETHLSIYLSLRCPKTDCQVF